MTVWSSSGLLRVAEQPSAEQPGAEQPGGGQLGTGAGGVHAARVDRLARLARARLYLCTERRDDFRGFARHVVAAGVDIVQLRHKGLEWRPERALLEELAGGVAAAGGLSAANDRADLVSASGVDVLHLGQGDIPPVLARRFVGPEVLLGLSTHGPAQLRAALADPDVDYFCVGPVWPTPTKPGRPGVGLGLLREAAMLAPPLRAGVKPWFVTGGVGPDTLDEVLATGARRVVVVRAITAAADPTAIASDLARRLAAHDSPVAGP